MHSVICIRNLFERIFTRGSDAAIITSLESSRIAERKNGDNSENKGFLTKNTIINSKYALANTGRLRDYRQLVRRFVSFFCLIQINIFLFRFDSLVCSEVEISW